MTLPGFVQTVREKIWENELPVWAALATAATPTECSPPATTQAYATFGLAYTAPMSIRPGVGNNENGEGPTSKATRAPVPCAYM